jgi:hypothetical protein
VRAARGLLRFNWLTIRSLLSSAQAHVESLLQQSNVADCTGVSLRRLLVANVRGRDDVDLFANVIEGQDTIEEHEHAVRDLQIDLRGSWYFFDAAHGIVGEKSDGAASERR